MSDLQAVVSLAPWCLMQALKQNPQPCCNPRCPTVCARGSPGADVEPPSRHTPARIKDTYCEVAGDRSNEPTSHIRTLPREPNPITLPCGCHFSLVTPPAHGRHGPGCYQVARVEARL